jgi:uracil-DNA glycosylase family 4
MRWTNTLNYEFELGQAHRFNVLLGQEMSNSGGSSLSVSADYFPSNYTKENAFARINQYDATATSMKETDHFSSGWSTPNRILSYFGRINYTLLDRYLFAVGIPRESVYIANILKCRPPMNRDPLPEEEDACIGYLREQVRLIQPKIIVCLGRISAMRLIKPDYRITREHGQFIRKGGLLMTAVYHPAALLRDGSKKEDMLLDFERIKEQLDLLTKA